MIKQTVGITSVAYYIPTGILTSKEMAKLANLPEFVFTDKIGIKQKPIAAQDEHPSDMGIKAALEAINKAKITAREIDLIVYCAAGDYDYRFWSPAAKIQEAIGAENAFAFEVRNFCNSGNLGIHICRNMLLADNDLSYALVVCSDKLSMLLDYTDVDSLSTFIMADGAAAAILKKGEPSNQILSYHAMTNGKFVDCLKVSSAGTKFPVGSTQINNDELNYLKVKNPQEIEKIFLKATNLITASEKYNISINSNNNSLLSCISAPMIAKEYKEHELTFRQISAILTSDEIKKYNNNA